MIKNVCILAAGFGKRQEFSKFSSKALVPFGKGSALDYLLGIIPKNKSIFIAVNYYSQDIINYLLITHPKKNIKFIQVESIDKINSGPAMSLLSCRPFLDKPFLLLACDSLPKKSLDFKGKTNWMGVYKKQNPRQYLNLEIKNNEVIQPIKEGESSKIHDSTYSFSGTAAIFDTNIFFSALSKSVFKMNSGDVLNGFLALRKKGLQVKLIDWYELGNTNDYKNSNIEYDKKYKFIDHAIPKTNAYIYFSNKKVIKFFENDSLSNNFFERRKFLSNLGPSELELRGRFVAYNFAKGKLLSYESDPNKILEVLNILNLKLWNKKTVISNESINLGERFYLHKTLDRIELSVQKFNLSKKQIFVNGNFLPDLETQLNKVNWEDLFKYTPSYFHGDPQPENIIVGRKKFTFIDWRTDFAGNLEYGDCYYDLGKIYHALVISGRAVRDNNFKVTFSNDDVNIKLFRYRNLIYMLNLLELWCEQNGYNIEKVRTIAALILLNISPLHSEDYGVFLFYMGRLLLNNSDKNWSRVLDKS
jgi:NDP-sugar pyrophosphorylase family protein